MEMSTRMEEELKCPACRRLYVQPVQLPGCWHSLCYQCAVSRAQACFSSTRSLSTLSTDSLSSCTADRTTVDCSDVISVVSETDSGVELVSRPASYVASSSEAAVKLSISCAACSHTATVEGGLESLTRTATLEAIVARYRESHSLPVHCQLCVNVNTASRKCQQCQLFLCDTCQHSTVDTHDIISLKQQQQGEELCSNCVHHVTQPRTVYCLVCRATVCGLCVQHGRHIGHHTQPMGAMSKAHKCELSQLIHSLSEKARSGTEFIARLKATQDRIDTNCVDFETQLSAQCDALIAAIRRRQQQLIASVRCDKSAKVQTYRDQVTQCTTKLHKTTGLLQYSVQVMKELDQTAFLQVSSPLIRRLSRVDASFVKEIEFEPRVSAEFELKLDTECIVKAIQNLNFVQFNVPCAPVILTKESNVLNNTITFVWEPAHNGPTASGYQLELDDGQGGGQFTEVFSGKETICTVEGLQYDTSYIARVKAFNDSGPGPYSHPVCLHTNKVAWFSFDPSTCSRDVLFTNNDRTVTTTSFDDRVVLANVGLMKGVHYWEFVVDRLDNNKDPAFGLATIDVSKDRMLGSDGAGWSMYVDCSRSWLMHAGVHGGRTDRGIRTCSVIGVLLDLDQYNVQFYIDAQQQGTVAFSGLLAPRQTYYPAISLNRNVQLTLHSGLLPPSFQ